MTKCSVTVHNDCLKINFASTAFVVIVVVAHPIHHAVIFCISSVASSCFNQTANALVAEVRHTEYVTRLSHCKCY